MNTIRTDPLSIVFNYLKYEDIVNFKLSNKSFDRMTKDMPIFRKKKMEPIIKVWGHELFRIIDYSVNLDNKSEYYKFLKVNNKNILQCLEFLYNDILFTDNWIPGNSGKSFTDRFIDVYDVFFWIFKLRDNYKDIFEIKRNFFIRKKLDINEIDITDKKLKLLYDITPGLNNFKPFTNFIQNILAIVEEREEPKTEKDFLKRMIRVELINICGCIGIKGYRSYFRRKTKPELINLILEKELFIFLEKREEKRESLNKIEFAELIEICKRHEISEYDSKEKYELINLILNQENLTNLILDYQFEKKIKNNIFFELGKRRKRYKSKIKKQSFP